MVPSVVGRGRLHPCARPHARDAHGLPPSRLQEDADTGLEAWQSMEMVDISVLDEAEAGSGGTADWGEAAGGSLLTPFCDSKDFGATQLRPLPGQLAEHAVGSWGPHSGTLSPCPPCPPAPGALGV